MPVFLYKFRMHMVCGQSVHKPSLYADDFWLVLDFLGGQFTLYGVQYHYFITPLGF